jgi:hypothetical protein
MQLTRLPVAIADPNLPIYAPPSAALQAVRDLNPTLLLDVQSAYVHGGAPTDPAAGFKAMTVADEALLKTVSATAHPTLVTAGAGHALRFGFGNNLGFPDNGCLLHEADIDYGQGADYAFGFVARVPTVGGVETGGPAGGKIIGARDDSDPSMIGFDYTGQFQWLHGAADNATFGDFDDGNWHTFLGSYDATADAVWIDVDGGNIGGALTGKTTPWGVERRLLIGATGAGSTNHWFIGDLAALVVLPVALHIAGNEAAKAAVAAWLAAVKARVD